MALALTHVDFAYGSLPILEDVSLAFPDRGVVCLSGPSGCGKTTLLRLLSGLEQPQRGRIEGLAGRKTAAVFQEDRLLPWMTALDNVALALPGGLRANRGRAAIARALAVNADLLLLDEPFTGIDPALRERIAGLLRQRAGSALLVLVTHIEEEARLLGSRILPLSPPLHGQLRFP